MSSNTRLRNKSDVDSTAVIATWMRRCGLPLAILAWSAVALLLLWLAGHVIQSLLLLTIAALLAYALAPGVKLLERLTASLGVFSLAIRLIVCVCRQVFCCATMFSMSLISTVMCSSPFVMSSA